MWSVEVFIGKLHMDFRVAASLGAHMEDTADDRAELVRSLLLEAGRLMEDASPQFALALPDHVTISTRIEDLVQIGSDLQAMAAAARALMRGLSAAGPTL